MEINQPVDLVLYYNLCRDVAERHEDLQSIPITFYRKVEKIVLTRGKEELLYLQLPNVGKLFDKSLSTGQLDLWEFSKVMKVRNFQDSWIFRTLLHRCIGSFGEVDRDIDVSIVASIRQLLFFFKRAKVPFKEGSVEEHVNDFVKIDTSLRTPHLAWDKDAFPFCRKTFEGSFLSGELDIYADILPSRFWTTLDRVCGRLCPQARVDVFDVIPKHGPGAVSDVRTGRDKFSAHSWPAKLGRCFDPAYFRSLNEFRFHEDIVLTELEHPCALLAVPKTYKGPRLIASEPTYHQFLQQGLMRWIRKNLPYPLRQSIDFTSQEPSKAAALEASLSGRLSTVDLSSASDRLSCWTVERAFSANFSFLSTLQSVRSRYLVDRTGTDPELSLKLRKFAAQGSAVTFPVQTIVYAMICVASIIYDNREPVTRRSVDRALRNVRVFGDDIVISSQNVATLSYALAAMQLKVNASKTHSQGYFRESCGMDAYHGHDVTPAYAGAVALPDPKKPESVVSWIDISNQLHRAGLWKTSFWMLQQVPPNIRRNLFYSGTEGPGIRAFTFCYGSYSPGRKRWNHHLHKQESRSLTLSAKVRKRARGSWDDLLQFVLEDPSPDVFWESGYITKNSLLLRREWV